MPRNPKRRSSGKVRKPTRPCTYQLGYVRQDLFACRKCSADNRSIKSGFCRGCKDVCHADHPESVIELYTKRAFRCDCGNNRDNITCQLCPHKEDMNVGNESCYSHNFEGRYCRCHQQYDPNLEMAQCAMCEDWFHENCYKPSVPNARSAIHLNVQYELTCFNCIRKLPLLADYYDKLNAWAPQHGPVKTPSHRACSRPKIQHNHQRTTGYDFLWTPAFRLALCRCTECMELYKAAKTLYIVDRADFVSPPDLDDSTLLNTTDDAEIINDLLHSEKEHNQSSANRAPVAKSAQRIPRKPLPPPPAPDLTPPQPQPSHPAPPNPSIPHTLTPRQIIKVRTNINAFLRRNIDTNGGHLNRSAIMNYLEDMKTDMLTTLTAGREE